MEDVGVKEKSIRTLDKDSKEYFKEGTTAMGQRV